MRKKMERFQTKSYVYIANIEQIFAAKLLPY